MEIRIIEVLLHYCHSVMQIRAKMNILNRIFLNEQTFEYSIDYFY